jgi:hypothetical protein
LERKRTLSEKASSMARKEEIHLIYGLLKSGEKEGVIGIDAKEKLQRLPSNIYWQGLDSWGIRLFKGTQPQYHHYLDVCHYAREQERFNDDGEPAGGSTERSWHGHLPSAPKDFPDLCSFNLSAGEASYLQERIVMNQSNSLLGFLAEHGRICDPVDYPWEHPQFASFPDQHKRLLAHARNFSEAIYGAPLVYNLMLAEQVHNRQLIDEYRDKIKEWAAELISKRLDILATWFERIGEFWDIIRAPSVRIPTLTKQFIIRWLSLVLKNGNASKIADSLEAKQVIGDRERQIKRALSRLDNARALELWSGHAGDFRLDYRWGKAQVLLNDIQIGLRSANHVESK